MWSDEELDTPPGEREPWSEPGGDPPLTSCCIAESGEQAHSSSSTSTTAASSKSRAVEEEQQEDRRLADKIEAELRKTALNFAPLQRSDVASEATEAAKDTRCTPKPKTKAKAKAKASAPAAKKEPQGGDGDGAPAAKKAQSQAGGDRGTAMAAEASKKPQGGDRGGAPTAEAAKKPQSQAGGDRGGAPAAEAAKKHQSQAGGSSGGAPAAETTRKPQSKTGGSRGEACAAEVAKVPKSQDSEDPGKGKGRGRGGAAGRARSLPSTSNAASGSAPEAATHVAASTETGNGADSKAAKEGSRTSSHAAASTKAKAKAKATAQSKSKAKAKTLSAKKRASSAPARSPESTIAEGGSDHDDSFGGNGFGHDMGKKSPGADPHIVWVGPAEDSDEDDGCQVVLHVYDFMRATKFAHVPIFHTAVEVHGWEFSFGAGAGIFRCQPRTACPEKHVHKKALPIGKTTLSYMQVERLIEKMERDWQGDTYNIRNRNCQTFTVDFLTRMGFGNDIPQEYVRFQRWGGSKNTLDAEVGKTAIV
eukprot:gnl/TRDRNA2_/TRDRNA2_169648_c0_seq1.p1 gnl/TRDRNA2_/TRDRNA2_169648_c0~~gnl/TRDRNA2_/TRDRNA2_169648_c0_seq1.p1  ORF type:complete len:533 (-),score=119.78 gnl/TRDRNA2_/TRDRNA2_169648_c0_seq1:26-1624(-)